MKLGDTKTPLVLAIFGAVIVALMVWATLSPRKQPDKLKHEAYSRGCMQTRINTNTNPWSVDFEWSPGPHFHSPKPPPIPKP